MLLVKKILSAGSSYQKFCRILRKYVMESSKEHSDWKFYQDIKIVPWTFDEQENFKMPSVSSRNLDLVSFNLYLKHEPIAQFLIPKPCFLNNCFPVCTIWTKEQNLNSRVRLRHWCTSFSSNKIIIYCEENDTNSSNIAIKKRPKCNI